MEHYRRIEQEAKKAFQQRYRSHMALEEVQYLIDEVSSDMVPTDHRDLLKVAMSNPDLATFTPMGPPAFDGENCAVNLIGQNIYESLVYFLTDLSVEKFKVKPVLNPQTI